ncbi:MULTISPECIES: alpha-ketoacid dehydrogenase subunit beta [Haloferax]|jgi:pyruvate dehydrogenase E1 component beta subunit|uniref:2-oxo-3-methylvalerate dehydrogenase E1 component subunit beta n=6 Tax=Haloferax TaxID=2251 RepID=A0A384KKS6_HALVD|nr:MULTISPECIES: alpha-ketoacid dehydrogenase subunit beta [Haloferax]AAD34203.1 pyruvate decarboxylase E1 beta subunit [Haloferax volcanii]ADE03245.1 2-oxo-3-methylvalerate dehydrogenase E1 component beta subunit [Haloferax volcanii DS2]ELY24564.1 2-oxo-3-methylvalerate dehydrogenase E1 component subunit beta [Haloferax volcanii DS2]ELZ70080.1 2-oxo-3-methylvalerate dehydrogenase E1 component subunit beta [Haloferax lucentense DSM 14919]ELZ90207.1 2-oxo-3-methylvalerate dehydrogenase E1 compo
MSSQNLTIVQAVRDGLYTEMNLDDEVLVMGEDVGKNGGVFRATEGLWDEFGDDRVIDTPLAESGIVGTAIGMAAMGLKPVPEIQFSGFMYPGFDQIVSHMGRFRNRTRGRYTLPMVLRAPYGGGIRAPESHSESKEMFYAHEAGLKVVIPSTPYDTKGLLISAIRDPDPVIFMEPKLIYRAFRGEVPEDDYTVPIGEAAVRREGTDVSVFTFGAMTRPTLEAVENLEEEGIDAEVVDIRTISPLDRETIVESFKKTGRAVVVHEAPKNGGLGAEITATVQEEALLYQEAPVKRVAGYDVPYPLYALEDYYLPSVARVEEGIREAVNF